MQDLRNLKIGIVPGINDAPKPANHEDNGRGPNGAYFTKKYNDLIDALNEVMPSFNEFKLLMANPPHIFEVGVPIILSPASLAFSWSTSFSERVSKVDLYLDDVKLNTESLPVDSGTYSYPINSVFSSPNYRDIPGQLDWKLEGTSTRGAIFEKVIRTEWRYKTIVGTSARADITSYNDPRFKPLSSLEHLGRPISITKPQSIIAEFLYIFLPVSIEGAYNPYTQWSINGFTTFDLIERDHTESRFGRQIPYRVYRSINPTHGSFTLFLT